MDTLAEFIQRMDDVQQARRDAANDRLRIVGMSMPDGGYLLSMSSPGLSQHPLEMGCVATSEAVAVKALWLKVQCVSSDNASASRDKVRLLDEKLFRARLALKLDEAQLAATRDAPAAEKTIDL